MAKWFSGMSYRDEQQYFEESLDAYNREEERINNERGLLARIFGGRKKPEPEQWNETHDEMALAFLTPQEKAQYQNEGYTREDMLAYAKDLIIDTAEKTGQSRDFNRDPVHGMMIVLKDRAELRGMDEKSWDASIQVADILRNNPENVSGPHIAKSARLNRVKAMMGECKTGRECLDFLNNEKCKIMLEPTDKGFEAFPKKGKIVISPAVPDEDMALLLVRGAVAVMDWKNFGEIDKALDDHDIRLSSSDGPYHYEATKEKYETAGVMTQQARFAHEMKDKNPNIREAFCKYGAGVYRAFEKGFETKKDVYQAMTDAFLKTAGEYDHKRVSDAYCKTFDGKSFYKRFEPQNAVRNVYSQDWNKTGTEHPVYSRNPENPAVQNARLNRVRTMMQGCETGKECVDFLDNEKYEVMFEPTDKGFEVFPEGKIVIHPAIPEEEMALLLVRGAVTAMDWKNSAEIDNGLEAHHIHYSSSDGPCGYLSTKEKYEAAGIMAQQARFAYEMKDKNPNIRKAFCEYGADVYQTFEKGLETKKDVYQAMTDAFLRKAGKYDHECVSDAYCKTFGGKPFYKRFEPKNAVRNMLVRNGSER